MLSNEPIRAVGFHHFGGPEALEILRVPRPLAGSGELVVQVAAATINPTDLLMLAGLQAAQMQGLHPPYIAGMEFAGRIHQVGAGVSHLEVGQRVMGIVNPRRPDGGAQAEFITTPVASVVPIPEGVDIAAAAAVPMNGLTAKMCLEALALPAGGTVLVTGAAGAVGSYVVQLAHHAGLRVVADAKDADREMLMGLGADELVPRGERFHDAVRAVHPNGVDGLVDGALLGDAAAALVRDGGTIALLRGSQVVTDTRVRQARIGVLNQATNTTALQWLADRVKDGSLVPRVSARFRMEDAATAYARVQQGGLRGRVVLMLDETNA